MSIVTLSTTWVVQHRKALIGLCGSVLVYALLGFFLAPWLIKKTAIEAVPEHLNATLSIREVAVNPFVLSLRVRGVELSDTDGQSLANIEEFFVNFQLSSIFRMAWSFKEFHLVSPEVNLVRDSNGVLNLSGLVRDQAEEGTADPSEPTEPPRLMIADFALHEGAVAWNDNFVPEPVTARFGPINVEIQELNTLPQRPGQQQVLITTETSGTFSWSGSLQFNPLRSDGHAEIRGSHFPLVSSYLRHDIGFDAVEGTADIGLEYSIVTADDGAISARIDNFDLAFRDVLLHTFNTEAENREVLRLPLFSLKGGALRWPEREVSVASVSVDDALVSIYRDAAGELNILPKPAVDDSAVDVDTRAGGNSTDGQWRVSLQELAVNRMQLNLTDDSVDPAADLGIQSLDLSIRDINNMPSTTFPTELRLVTRAGGSVSLDGTISALPTPTADLSLSVEDLVVAAAHPYIKTMADVNLDSGLLSIGAQLRSSAEEPLAVNGNLSIDDFLITETDQGSRLGSWKRFEARKFSYSEAAQSLEISEIHFLQPYGDVLIAEDGSVNLGRISKDEASEADAAADTAPESNTSPGPAITIGRVVVEDAAADFTDKSLPLPFAANIDGLNGDMSTIATESQAPSTVNFEGKVDEFGFVRVSGTVTPFDTSRDTDLKVAFQNVEMPKFSSYTVPFAGRKISTGKLDLDLGYKVTNSELVGENKIVLRELELGEKVPHPGAMSLPLSLAVALLKDSEGKIDIDLPVRGNVDDPEFRYGPVVLKALGNLIVKIVASPFSLLGKLVGVEPSELEYIAFLPGRADLTPPELERAAKIAEALGLRPELRLELRGVLDRDADSLALQTSQLDELVASQIAASDASESDQSMYAEMQQEVLETLYANNGMSDDPKADLSAMRERFTALEEFDAAAYTAELRNVLIAAQPLGEEQLAGLADERVRNVRAAILQSDDGLASRIVDGEVEEVTNSEGESVRMPVTLQAAD